MKSNKVYMPKSPQKDFKDLMSSIENKLQLLASEHFQIEDKSSIFAHSMPPLKEYQSPYKPQLEKSKQGLQLSDLCPNKPSPVMSKLDQIEQHYISQLNTLNHRLTYLQTENSSLNEQNHRLNEQLNKNTSRLQILQRQQANILQSRIEELQQKLLNKIRQQIEDEISKYLNQLQIMRKELSGQRKAVRQLQHENDVLKGQRGNLQGLYKDLLQKYKNIVQSEIDTSQIHHQHAYNASENERNYHNRYTLHQNYTQNTKEKPKETKGSHDKKGKKSKSSKVQASELSRQQIIPFLTKGIEQLKQKLKLK